MILAAQQCGDRCAIFPLSRIYKVNDRHILLRNTVRISLAQKGHFRAGLQIKVGILAPSTACHLEAHSPASMTRL